MNLHVHPEGIAFLKGFAVCLLVLMLFAMRFTSWPWDWLFGKLITKSAEAMDSPEDHLPRRLRRRFELKKEDRRKAKVSFYVLCTVLGTWVIADWFLLPDNYSVGNEWRWPLTTSAFFAGGIAIIIGRCYFDQRIGWSKWSFWLALAATALGLLVFFHWLNPSKPRAVLDWMVTGCFLALLVFLYFFGMLRRVERSLSEAQVAPDLDAAAQLASTAVAAPTANISKRRPRRRKR